jgi:hypothetical protein
VVGGVVSYGFQIRSLLGITIRIKHFLLNHPLKAIFVGELGYLGEERER